MDDSIAFDTNLLAKPTPRRLMTLWLEQAGCNALILPRVYEELTAPSLAQRDKRSGGRNAQAEEWDEAISSPNSPYLLSAHPWGEASRHLLVTALASSWPGHLRPLGMEDAKSVLDGLCGRLATGANMPDVAQRLLNAYDIDENLAEVLLDAHAVATKSVALAIERRRAEANQRSAPHGGQADAIREHALANYVVPWRESDLDVLAIRAGDVVREMGLRNATPNVCSALEGRKFLSLANLALVRRDGPRRSTTTTYHYRSTS